jgi:hypothetical protein
MINPISNNGKIVIKMPELLTLGDINTKVRIVDMRGNRDQLKATEGTVISSNEIEITDVFGLDSKIGRP